MDQGLPENSITVVSRLAMAGPKSKSNTAMLFMVIAHFKNRGFQAVDERFKSKGRMLPKSVIYLACWIDARYARCFQIMEAPDRESLEPWIAAWKDVVDFEVVPVQTSAEYWATVQKRSLRCDRRQKSQER